MCTPVAAGSADFQLWQQNDFLRCGVRGRIPVDHVRQHTCRHSQTVRRLLSDNISSGVTMPAVGESVEACDGDFIQTPTPCSSSAFIKPKASSSLAAKIASGKLPARTSTAASPTRVRRFPTRRTRQRRQVQDRLRVAPAAAPSCILAATPRAGARLSKTTGVFASSRRWRARPIGAFLEIDM